MLVFDIQIQRISFSAINALSLFLLQNHIHVAVLFQAL